MENNLDYNYSTVATVSEIAKSQRQYLSKVYTWMVSGLLSTAITSILFMAMGLQNVIMDIPFGYLIVVLAQFGLVIFLSVRINKLSPTAAIMSFLGYSILTGITFSVILTNYDESLIYTTFSITAAMFGGLSLYGFVTKKNLSGVGSFMFMGLIGIIIASIVNYFLQSSAMHFIINVIGVIVFAGLTAYDTQKIKEMHYLQMYGNEIATKGAIIGALMLYLDFINLFLFLLRLFRR